jgi:hypothetical protein
VSAPSETSATGRSRRWHYGGIKAEGEIGAIVGQALEGFDACLLPTIVALGFTAGDDDADHGITVAGREPDFYLMGAWWGGRTTTRRSSSSPQHSRRPGWWTSPSWRPALAMR